MNLIFTDPEDCYPWTDAARWTPTDLDNLDELDPVPEPPLSPPPVHVEGELLTGYTRDRKFLAWVQIGDPFAVGVEGFWMGDGDLIDQARRERAALSDPDDIGDLAGVVVRVLGAGAKPDWYTKTLALMATHRVTVYRRG
ncbi:hypothetical protein [Mycolicibacterium fallax]|uniref:Uncharacterized protein n=1 Tax=Mycolicibacterium fallax TaxID=1793 RepID=A0A1X1RFX5_MYCFA|nr:hypothetical protein [Mycolicibacterium fallax]ORV04613.1 hypothetical protein AWC04_08450 [Mycolicibacterium fallax]BBY99643.1 hypothetical protein MFAL_31100 [Mycolicibacterium fallax]